VARPTDRAVSGVERRTSAIYAAIRQACFREDFRPSPGTLTEHFPPGGMGVRVDTHCYAGYTIPPQADAGWIGEAGPGASYGDDGAGLDNDFTQRNATIMTWNLMHFARLLRDAGGVPAHGNRRDLWEAGCRFDHPNPDYR